MDMQIVINIDEEDYNNLIEQAKKYPYPPNMFIKVQNCIINGTPLSIVLDGMLEDAYEHGYQQAKYDYEVQPCGDVVKREAVLNTLDTMDKALDENRTVETYKELLKECYKELPSVTPRTGKWIRKVLEVENDDVRITYECSECGVDQLFKEHYCPDCGAKMEGENK